MQIDRAAFEEIYSHLDLRLNDKGEYEDQAVYCLWEGYTLGLKSKPEQPVECTEEFEKWMKSQGFDIPCAGFWEQKMEKAWQAAWAAKRVPVRELRNQEDSETA